MVEKKERIALRGRKGERGVPTRFLEPGREERTNVSQTGKKRASSQNASLLKGQGRENREKEKKERP